MIKAHSFICFISFSILFFSCENQSALVSIKFDGSISTIEHNSPFKLSLVDNHPTELAIVSPENQWFYLQGNDIKKPHMQAEDFKQSKSYSIETHSLKAVQWIDGKATVSPVFTVPGIYEIYLSDNLETEPENALTFIKRIKYTH